MAPTRTVILPRVATASAGREPSLPSRTRTPRHLATGAATEFADSDGGVSLDLGRLDEVRLVIRIPI